MRLSPWFASCAILLSSFAASATLPSDDAAKAVKAAVEKKLLAPLKRKEAKRSKFSRAASPPRERRVRVLDAEAREDVRGKRFRSFAVDARYGAREQDEGWMESSMVGCVYPGDGAMYVQISDDYYPAKRLLGKKSKKAPRGVCQPAADEAGKLADAQAASSR